jgi:hypothetical protein
VVKIDYYMLQQRHIVKASGKQIDIQYLVGTKYAITSFHYIARILISVNVTIYRNESCQRYETSHCIITTKLGRCI